MSRIIGIKRNTEYSPNSNDLAIMLAVAQDLEADNHHVDLLDEEEFLTTCPNADAYFSMARNEHTLNYLQELENRGKTVVNHAQGVKNCSRPVITALMEEHQIPTPKSYTWEVSSLLKETPKGLAYPAWLKRGDSCAKQKEDVSYVRNEEEFSEVVKDFSRRGIKQMVYNQHLEGDVVKFYGVADTDFFYWFYPTLDGTHSKFGLEAINGPASQYPFDVTALKKTVDHIANCSQTPIYGGDCIVDASGQYRIIDFNDWPSFSRCINEAAKAITQYIANHLSK